MDAWQPVDDGFGRFLKSLLKAKQQEWWECDDNFAKWVGNSDIKLIRKNKEESLQLNG